MDTLLDEFVPIELGRCYLHQWLDPNLQCDIICTIAVVPARQVGLCDDAGTQADVLTLLQHVAQHPGEV